MRVAGLSEAAEIAKWPLDDGEEKIGRGRGHMPRLQLEQSNRLTARVVPQNRLHGSRLLWAQAGNVNSAAVFRQKFIRSGVVRLLKCLLPFHAFFECLD